MPDRIEVRAVRNGGVDYIEVPTAEEAAAAALLRERAGYVMRRLPDRIAAVDAELSRLGIDPPDHADTHQMGAENDGNREQRGTGRARSIAAGRRATAERG